MRTDGITADFENGLLTVRLPKAEEAVSRKIKVSRRSWPLLTPLDTRAVGAASSGGQGEAGPGRRGRAPFLRAQVDGE